MRQYSMAVRTLLAVEAAEDPRPHKKRAGGLPSQQWGGRGTDLCSNPERNPVDSTEGMWRQSCSQASMHRGTQSCASVCKMG